MRKRRSARKTLARVLREIESRRVVAGLADASCFSGRMGTVNRYRKLAARPTSRKNKCPDDSISAVISEKVRGSREYQLGAVSRERGRPRETRISVNFFRHDVGRNFAPTPLRRECVLRLTAAAEIRRASFPPVRYAKVGVKGCRVGQYLSCRMICERGERRCGINLGVRFRRPVTHPLSQSPRSSKLRVTRGPARYENRLAFLFRFTLHRAIAKVATHAVTTFDSIFRPCRRRFPHPTLRSGSFATGEVKGARNITAMLPYTREVSTHVENKFKNDRTRKLHFRCITYDSSSPRAF